MVAKFSGYEQAEMMGWNFKSMFKHKPNSLIGKLSRMSPQQRKAYFHNLPAWKKVLLMAAGPALFPFVTMSPTAMIAAAAMAKRLHGNEAAEMLGANWFSNITKSIGDIMKTGKNYSIATPNGTLSVGANGLTYAKGNTVVPTSSPGSSAGAATTPGITANLPWGMIGLGALGIGALVMFTKGHH